MTMGVRAERQGRVCHSGERRFPTRPVILRSEGDEESLGHALGRERRFFAALRMTEQAQNDKPARNDKGKKLSF